MSYAVRIKLQAASSLSVCSLPAEAANRNERYGNQVVAGLGLGGYGLAVLSHFCAERPARQV